MNLCSTFQLWIFSILIVTSCSLNTSSRKSNNNRTKTANRRDADIKFPDPSGQYDPTSFVYSVPSDSYSPQASPAMQSANPSPDIYSYNNQPPSMSYVSQPSSSYASPPTAPANGQPSPEYGAPPMSQYGPPMPPSSSYGPPMPPSNSYGPPMQPSNSYGPPMTPSNSYGPPMQPSNSYGPPMTPSNSYGPPMQPSNSYGPPMTPSNSYGSPPMTPSNSYGPPMQPSNSYGSPPAAYGVPMKSAVKKKKKFSIKVLLALSAMFLFVIWILFRVTYFMVAGIPGTYRDLENNGITKVVSDWASDWDLAHLTSRILEMISAPPHVNESVRKIDKKKKSES